MHRSASLSLGFTAPLAWRSLICRLSRRQGRLGCLPFNATPAGLPLRGNCQKDWLARASSAFASLRRIPLPAPPVLLAALPFGFAQIGVLGAHPPSAYSPACARQFGFAFGQTPAHLVCNGCSPVPPETRKVSGSAP